MRCYRGRTLKHLFSLVFFGTLAVLWSWPLAWNAATHLPGFSIGDNATFLWNFWWMRTALAERVSFFHTTYLFAPFGADLTLDTHTALPAFIGATVLGKASPLVALNVMILVGLALNGYCAYLLAWRVSNDRAGAVIAGIMFGASPYVAAHLNGHFNLTMAWTIPLFAMAALTAIRDLNFAAAVAGGLILGATTYVDDYYVVYELTFALLLIVLVSTSWSIAWRAAPPLRWIWVVLVLVAAIDVCAFAATVLSGWSFIRIGPLIIRADTAFNELQVLWVVGIGVFWNALRPRIRGRWRPTAPPMSATAAVFGVLLVTFLAVASPLVFRGVQLLVSGEYVSPAYFWRSAPVGVDIASLVLGNPSHGVWGATVRSAYDRFDINLIESGAWLGIAPVALALLAVVRKRTDPAVQAWTAIGLLFFVWALGSHLHAFGWNTGAILPGTLLRFVPIVSNARMPGRAIVMVYLALAVLSAIAIADWRKRSRYTQLLPLLLGLSICVDFMSAPFPTTPVDCARTFWTLRTQYPLTGAVAVLPLGLADGFGDLTPFDRSTLACQSVHERPMVGGFISRLSPALVTRYWSDPLLGAWLRLSGARSGAAPIPTMLPNRELAARQLQADGIAFIMLNRHTTPDDLRNFVVKTLPVREIAADDQYVLLRVEPVGDH